MGGGLGFVFVFIFFFEVLGIEPRALCVLTKISTTELHPHPGTLGSLEFPIQLKPALN